MFAEPIAPISRNGLTLRVVESGVFQRSLAQGLELELINQTDSPIACEVRLVLRRSAAEAGDLPEVQRNEKRVQIPAHARQGFRVAEPLAYGRCRAQYEIKINGTQFASEQVEFVSPGPYRLQVRPWFLTRNAVQVTVELLQPTGKERFRFRLLDSKRQKVLFETEDCRRIVDTSPYGNPDRPRTRVEGFVRFERGRPGDYVVEVEVRETERATNAAKLTATVVRRTDR